MGLKLDQLQDINIAYFSIKEMLQAVLGAGFPDWAKYTKQAQIKLCKWLAGSVKVYAVYLAVLTLSLASP
jgi:hypothetical protein